MRYYNYDYTGSGWLLDEKNELLLTKGATRGFDLELILEENERIRFWIEPFSNAEPTLNDSPLIYTHTDTDVEEYEYTFVLTPLKREEEYDFVREKIVRDPHDLPERKFGNDDIMLLWGDGRILNLKYIKDNKLSLASKITDKSISSDRIHDKSYVFTGKRILDVKLVIGDVWYRDNGDSYRQSNRSMTLKILNDLYRNKTIMMLMSDIDIFNYCVLSEFDIEQKSDSDNTYIARCKFENINIILGLQKTMVISDIYGVYNEVPIDEDMIRVRITEPLTLDDEQRSYWEKIKDSKLNIYKTVNDGYDYFKENAWDRARKKILGY